MTGNTTIDILLIILISIIAVFLIFFILGKFLGPVKRLNNRIKNIFPDIGKKIRNKREQKRKIAEQERIEEIQRLEVKQVENNAFISALKGRINDLQKIYKELEDKEKESSAMIDELIDKIKQIDALNEKPAKFIFKLINDSKIRKLTGQCGKHRQKITEVNKVIAAKKNEIKDSAGALLDSLE